ncbi:MAG: hypothetical protein QOF76_5560, partial [Solirubrobacteraceae bacterium]|nr:hypothetical protein [Solirubrobacteraceae bacterium]
TVDCAQASHLVARPTLADDARVVPGSASVTVGGSSKAIDNPTAAGFDLGPACAGQPQDYVPITLTFKVEPGSDLGPGRSTVDVTADGGSLTASASTTTDDSLDPGDDTTTARTLPDGDIVTGHIASPTDVDFFRIPAPSTGSKLTVTLTHLPADYDLSILGPPSSLPTAPLRANPLRANPLRANPVPDQTGEPIDTGTPADTLQDIPLRANPLRANPLRANSINRGGSDESATITATSADQGKDFFVAVTSFNGATDPRPYFVRATTRPAAAEPPCAAGPSLAGGAGHSLPASVPSATRALILVNQSRMQQRDGAAATNRVMTALNAIAPAMNTAVIPVDVGATSAAYAALDANPCSPDAANGVVTAINGVVDKIRSDNNLRDLQSIQIVGPDSEIPQARVVDQTVLSNESDYADSATFRGNDDAVSRAEREGYLLTDDVYGDFDPSVELYVPDVALGRLVESADQIADQVEAFNTAGGVVNPQRSFVAGYDFLADGAQRTFDALAPVAAGQLLQESWTADQARDGANAAGASFTSINGHYDNYRALPGAASSRLLGAGEVAPPAGSVLFTVGCHAGLNLALQLSGPSADEAARLDDWAEQVSAKKALYTANTGFGYGDTEAVAYSERLMADYADQLASRQVTAGQALMFAKQRDAAALSSTDDYWNKALMESTFYGIAMYRVGANGKEAGTVIPRDLGGTPDAVRASSVYTITPSALLNRHDTDSGSYWTAGQDPLVVQNRPIQPVVTTDVTPDDLAPVHGAEIEALSTTELTGIDHVIARPIVDDSPRETEPADANPYFPAQLLSTTPVQTPNGAKEKLTLVAGQSRDDVQRLINSATVRVYRSRSADYEPNVITRVDGLVSGGAYSIAVDVLGGDEDGGRVLFRTDASGAWQSVALAKVAPGRLGAGGALPAGATKIVEAQVWVHDTHGNTAFSNSKVVGYSFQPLAIAAGDPKIVLSPGAPATGYYSTPPIVTLDQGDHASAAFEYSIDNGAWKTYSGPVSVGAPTEGEHIVRVRGSDGSQALNRFAVDTQGPTVDASATTAPNFNNWYAGPVTVHFTCADAVSGVASCPADKTLASDGAGQSVSGTATDRAGLSGSGGLTGINIDTVKPTITGKADRAANADGWYNAPVTVTFTCADALSLIDTCTAPVTVDEAQDGSAAGTARDKAGNEATASVDHLRVDRTDPTAVVTSAGLLLLSKVQGTAADADTTNPKAVSGVKSVKVTYTRTSGGTPIVKAATLTCNADRSSCTWVADPPSLGFWNVKADSTDLAGRTGTSAISTISIN